MNPATPLTPIAGADDAERALANLGTIMDSLIDTVAEETTRVRAGRLRQAAELTDTKVELARRYTTECERIKAARDIVVRSLPDALNRLRQRHAAFHAMLQTNLTVLATAHAVSEGIVRGVSEELARKQTPSTYGAHGRANAPNPRAGQPLSVSRTL
ncbi:MAG TPA: hypothetical protein VG986_20510 [Pseudolabrys sp.]|nr:hypothetical protein [Pseudolabrys sp.]